MEQSKERENIAFDFEKACACAENYAKATGVSCAVIDADANYVSPRFSHCVLCQTLKQITGLDKHCLNSRLYGSYQAERFGGKYIYFCPNGLVHWISPITLYGSIVGALVGGPAIMVDYDDYIYEDILSRNQIEAKYTEEIKKAIETIPYVPPDQVSALSEQLYITATFLCDTEYLARDNKDQSLKQQSAISEYIKQIKSSDDSKYKNSYPFMKEKQLLSLISQGDKKAAQKLLNEILGHILFLSGSEFSVIKARVLELIVLLSRAAMEGGADPQEIFGLNYKYINEINSYTNIEDMCHWLSKIMIRFTDYVFNLVEVKHVDVIFKAIEYMKANYMNKITLEGVAKHVYLSPSYFSKIFKEEMNCPFNHYMNQIRVEESKKLLLNPEIKLVDISNMTGFEDQSYYCKVFKKIVGITPGKFRESRGKLKEMQ